MYKKVLLLGSGALKIGEAGEFDYSGSQAIKALREERIFTILVNPNIATIQTSKGLADKVYFLPVTPEFVEKVIRVEKPDGIILSFGGQTALNCGVALHRLHILKKHEVEVLGTSIQTIIDTEDRRKFGEKIMRLGFKIAKGQTCDSLTKALTYVQKIEFPVMVRAGYALGGSGSGIAQDINTFETLLRKAFTISPQVIIEENLNGWKEIEYEVVRDQDDNAIAVCNMENMDPVGIHTGESIVVAPSQTLSNSEYYTLRQIAIDIIRHFKIVGECNIQFAIHPTTRDLRIIEVNARLSRSSALASKATGYPLAYVAAKLAIGKKLTDLTNSITGKTSAFFEPALDYVVIKIPRWDLDKYERVETEIGSEMKSVGEVMSIARSFEEGIQKACRMLGNGNTGVIDEYSLKKTKSELIRELAKPTSKRLLTITSALYRGISINKIQELTRIDPWYLEKLKRIVNLFRSIQQHKNAWTPYIKEAKQCGFSDKQLGDLAGVSEEEVRKIRFKKHIVPVIKQIDTMAGEFPARTNYLYLTYNGNYSDRRVQKSKPKAIVIGAGPYSIGTSVEFDWCAVNTVRALKDQKVQSVMINCNPETVSTDYDISEILYFEELTIERIQDIYETEKAPIIVSVGGQIPNTLVSQLAARNIPILGTAPEMILQAENRKNFSNLLDKLKIGQPRWGRAAGMKSTLLLAGSIGYPVLVRPSFVLSGKGMEVIWDESQLRLYLQTMRSNREMFPIVVSKYISQASECDVDGVAHRGDLIASAISEHVEGAGIHSGDSTLLLPTRFITQKTEELILQYTKQIIKELKVSGPFNIQYLIKDEIPYVIECNLRASRSFPFVSKVLNLNFISLATKVLLGKNVPQLAIPKITFQAAKVPQFSFTKLRGSDPVLRVEMRSTGEVAAFGKDIYDAYLKAILATGIKYPTKKAVFLSLGGEQGKLSFINSARNLSNHGYTIYATSGTALFLNENGIKSQPIGKLYEEIHPNFIDLLSDKSIDFSVVLPTTSHEGKIKDGQQVTDGYIIRRLSIDYGVPIFTTYETAQLFVDSLIQYVIEDLEIKPWQEYVERERILV
ncbi:carbamoyl-phosphate synthase (glutamine-hydrolyzing) large subunit [Candidatus Gottesmanbacteria bacterium]|nr:carbamoyl-phosphate synthase (glutamine-hydrolyzing) large subunit [Candidatus Gottesmanbacteria bacterium]